MQVGRVLQGARVMRTLPHVSEHNDRGEWIEVLFEGQRRWMLMLIHGSSEPNVLLVTSGEKGTVGSGGGSSADGEELRLEMAKGEALAMRLLLSSSLLQLAMAPSDSSANDTASKAAGLLRSFLELPVDALWLENGATAAKTPVAGERQSEAGEAAAEEELSVSSIGLELVGEDQAEAEAADAVDAAVSASASASAAAGGCGGAMTEAMLPVLRACAELQPGVAAELGAPRWRALLWRIAEGEQVREGSRCTVKPHALPRVTRPQYSPPPTRTDTCHLDFSTGAGGQPLRGGGDAVQAHERGRRNRHLSSGRRAAAVRAARQLLARARRVRRRHPSGRRCTRTEGRGRRRGEGGARGASRPPAAVYRELGRGAQRQQPRHRAGRVVGAAAQLRRLLPGGPRHAARAQVHAERRGTITDGEF